MEFNSTADIRIYVKPSLAMNWNVLPSLVNLLAPQVRINNSLVVLCGLQTINTSAIGSVSKLCFHALYDALMSLPGLHSAR